MASRQFKSVSELVRTISDSAVTAELVEKKIAERAIVSQLIAMRLKRDLSQGDIAKEMGCTQSRVSKLENGLDKNLTFADIEAYLKALQMQMGVMFYEEGHTLMERVKMHAFRIVSGLQEIASLSNGDQSMEQAAVLAHMETMMNMARLIGESGATIPLFQQELQRVVQHSKKGKGKKVSEPPRVHLVSDEPLTV